MVNLILELTSQSFGYWLNEPFGNFVARVKVVVQPSGAISHKECISFNLLFVAILALLIIV